MAGMFAALDTDTQWETVSKPKNNKKRAEEKQKVAAAASSGQQENKPYNPYDPSTWVSICGLPPGGGVSLVHCKKGEETGHEKSYNS